MHVVFQERDQTSFSFVARSLVTLQQLYGAIPSVYGLGNCAKVFIIHHKVRPKAKCARFIILSAKELRQDHVLCRVCSLTFLSVPVFLFILQMVQMVYAQNYDIR